MLLVNVITFYVSVFNAFIVITCLKYPLNYRRRAANKRPIARVVDGEDADRLEYAYVVALERFPGIYNPGFNFTVYRACTGSLINKQFVISAAHCSEGADRIRYGDLTVPSSSTRASHSNITRKFIHVKHENRLIKPYQMKQISDSVYMMKNDIALYKVEPVHLSKYADLSAVDYKTLTGLPVRYVGLGISYFSKMNETEINKRIVEDETRERQIGYAVVKPCGKSPSAFLIYYPLICLAWKCNSNQLVNSGDSGGPLLHAGKIVGVLVGYAAIDGQPAVDGQEIGQIAYTPVSVYLDWITHVVNSEN